MKKYLISIVLHVALCCVFHYQHGMQIRAVRSCFIKPGPSNLPGTPVEHPGVSYARIRIGSVKQHKPIVDDDRCHLGEPHWEIECPRKESPLTCGQLHDFHAGHTGAWVTSYAAASDVHFSIFVSVLQDSHAAFAAGYLCVS